MRIKLGISPFYPQCSVVVISAHQIQSEFALGCNPPVRQKLCSRNGSGGWFPERRVDSVPEMEGWMGDYMEEQEAPIPSGSSDWYRGDNIQIAHKLKNTERHRIRRMVFM